MGNIFAFGEIDEEFYENFVQELFQHDECNLFLTSVGGDIELAFAMYDLIRSHGNVRTIGVGRVYSAAVIVMQASKIRLLSENSLMMLHHPTVHVEDTLDNALSYLNTTEKLWINALKLLSEKTNLSVDELKRLLANDLYLTADEAIELGLIDGKLK